MDKGSRRGFLKQTGSQAVGAGTALAVQRAVGANRRLRLAVIGCGGQGTSGHVDGLASLRNDQVDLVYVCDPDRKRRNTAAEWVGGAQPVGDLRKILDDKSIDGVSIATPDHWHVPAALLALEAGKGVYLEKPCSHNVREGRLLVEAVRRTGGILQHGTQARSDPGFTEAVGMLRQGVIGEVLVARAWNIQRRSAIGNGQPGRPPAELDYDTWVGPAPMIPFHANRHHYNWHWWYHYGTGDLGNDGVHEFDMARWGLGVTGHPSQVAVIGGKYFFDDDQQFPDTVTATFEYPGDGAVGHRKQLVFEMRIWCTNYPHQVDGGVEFYGTKGKLFVSRRGKFQVWGERNQKHAATLSRAPQMNVTRHLQTWIAALRGEGNPTANAEVAHHAATLCHLANIGCRVGRSFGFDPQEEAIVNDPQAAAGMRRAYRPQHWAVPRGV